MQHGLSHFATHNSPITSRNIPGNKSLIKLMETAKKKIIIDIIYHRYNLCHHLDQLLYRVSYSNAFGKAIEDILIATRTRKKKMGVIPVRLE